MSNTVDKNALVYVAGHRGLVGSALCRALNRAGYARLLTRSHAELDLCDQAAVAAFFAQHRPDVVILAAAKVGGIHANATYPAEFIYQNLQIQNNVIHSAWRNGCKKLLFLGSSCIYPKLCPQPIREEYLLTGPLEPTNDAYALAKISGVRPTANSTALTPSAPCPPICTAPATTTIRKTAMWSRRLSADFTRPKSPARPR